MARVRLGTIQPVPAPGRFSTLRSWGKVSLAHQAVRRFWASIGSRIGKKGGHRARSSISSKLTTIHPSITCSTNHYSDESFSVLTKFGGVPYWTGNGPGEFPDPPFHYLAQFDTLIHCEGAVPTANEAGTAIRYNHPKEEGGAVTIQPDAEHRTEARHVLMVNRDGVGFYGDWANLGSDGTGFLYINPEADPVEVVWFWER